MPRFFHKFYRQKPPEPNPGRAGLRADQIAEIEQFIERAIREGKMGGAVLLISRNGEIASHRAMGWLDREARAPMRLDALFYVLSMTKAVTCAALLTAVDEGKVSLDDPVELWLPEFKGIGLVDGGTPEEVPLLRQCMSHSAGLLDSFPESFLKTRYTLPEYLSVGARNRLGYEPGQGWAYCNLGIAVAGRVIELASKQSYLEAVQERVLRPLGMKDSFFRVPARHTNRMASIYRLTKGELVREHSAPFENSPDYVAPENGLRTTAFDFWRFYEMIRNDGKLDGRRVLSETSARAMKSVQTGICNAGFLPGMGYGYGLSLLKTPTGMFRNHSIGTFGHGSYYQAQAWVDPVKGISAMLFSHNPMDHKVVTPQVETLLPMLGALSLHDANGGSADVVELKSITAEGRKPGPSQPEANNGIANQVASPEGV